MHTPFGENRTTFTAAECRLRVARYSTLGGRGAFAVDVGSDSATMEGGLRCGCTIHIYVKNTNSQHVTLRALSMLGAPTRRLTLT